LLPEPLKDEETIAMPFKGLLKAEVDGKPSTMRVLFFLWAIVVLAVWAVVSLRSGQVQDMPTSLAAILATFAGSKAVQSFAEAWRQKPT
jgi:hypothetical protein